MSKIRSMIFLRDWRSFGRLMLAAVFLLSFHTGCTYTSAVSQTNIPSQRQNRIEASSKKYIVLLFNFDNDEVLTLTKKLQDQCPNGKVTGILTKDLRTMYFLFFFWAREQVVSGYCQNGRFADINAGSSDGLGLQVSEAEGEI